MHEYINMFKKNLAVPTGFEPVTCPLGGGCSIQLSHGTTRRIINKPILQKIYIYLWINYCSHKTPRPIESVEITIPIVIPPNRAGSRLFFSFFGGGSNICRKDFSKKNGM